MTRGTRVTIFALVTLCSLWVAGCSSNPSGVNTQDPPSATTTTPVASASSTPVSSAPVSETSFASSPLSSAQTTPTAKSSPSTSSPPPLRSSAPPPPKTTATADPEAANRAAIEAVWAKYWVISLGLTKVPAIDRLTLMETVAIPSIATTVVGGAAKEVTAGEAGYGRVVHRPSWATPVGGKSTAVMNDCMNDYNAGTLDVKTGKPIRAGIYRDNFRATFTKGSDGLWRVAKIEYLENVPC
jgi:hypothetical protein